MLLKCSEIQECSDRRHGLANDFRDEKHETKDTGYRDGGMKGAIQRCKAAHYCMPIADVLYNARRGSQSSPRESVGDNAVGGDEAGIN